MEESTATAPRKSSPLKWVLAGCGGCGVLVVGFAVVVGGLAAVATQGAFKAAHEHVDLVQQGKVDEAYSTTSPRFQESVDRETFGAFVKQWPVLYAPGADFTVTSRVAFNDRAQMRGSVTGPDGRTGQASIQLEKVAGAWRVAGVDVTVGEGQLGEGQEAVEAVRAHLARVQGGDLDGAYAETTTAAFRESTDRAAFESWVQQHPVVYGPGAELLSPTRETRDGEARVTGTARGADGTEARVVFLLHRADGGWQVQGVDVAPPATPASSE